MSALLIGLGYAVGAGLLLAWVVALRTSPLSLRVRVAISPAAGSQASGAHWGRTRRLGRARTQPELASRLKRAGWHTDVAAYRSRRAASAIAGAVIGVAAAFSLGSIAVMPIVAALGMLIGHLGCDYLLGRAVLARAGRLTAELPALADLLAFAVSAGESTTGALRRVVAISSGELVKELNHALADVRSGTPLPIALTALADRVQVPAVERFVSGLVLAADRGTPMAEVLRAQAADARSSGQRDLIESAGRREVFMLMPVVFLILPTVVLVALYPGLAALRLSVP